MHGPRPPDAALPLLQPRRSPRQVVVNDPLRPLEIEPLGGHVGSEENAGDGSFERAVAPGRVGPGTKPVEHCPAGRALSPHARALPGAPGNRSHAKSIAEIAHGRASAGEHERASAICQDRAEPGDFGIGVERRGADRRAREIERRQVIERQLGSTVGSSQQFPEEQLIVQATGEGSKGLSPEKLSGFGRVARVKQQTAIAVE